MEYTIKALSPELATTFTDYLDNLDYAHEPHWSTCYCRFYHTDCSFEQWKNRSGQENRQEAIEQIRAGKMKGYLAFDGDKCIGWCNANKANEYLRLQEYIGDFAADKKVGIVICFVIHQEYRRQGVARLLLKQAVEDFKKQGYDGVLAMPVDIKDKPEKLYRGTVNMYKEQGFKEIERHENVSVVWLEF